MAEIKVLALDLDGTLTNSQKEVTPRTRAALDAAIAKGVTIVLASGRPTAGVLPLAKELGLDKKGGCILSYNGGKIIDCRTGETLYQKQLDAQYVPELCAFAAAQNVTIITYNKEGVVTEHPDDKWALRECFTCKLPMTGVDDLAKYVDYPICKMLITLDPARRDEVWAAGRKQFEKAFEELGLEYFSDGANFVMVKVADAPKKFVEMQKRGVIVRPNVGYGLPDWLRITIGKPEQNERCIEELSKLVK